MAVKSLMKQSKNSLVNILIKVSFVEFNMRILKYWI